MDFSISISIGGVLDVLNPDIRLILIGIQTRFLFQKVENLV
jgi:hypothetical protein